jgi:peptidyl-prolyl cis-trans isomerase SurA
VPEAGGVVVTFVDGVEYQPFAEVRTQLEQQAAETVQQAAVELVGEVQDDLGVTVNPRFGELDEGRVVAVDGGVVDILEDEAAADEAAE